MVNQDHPLAEFLDILHVVTGQQRHHAVSAVIFPEKLTDFLLADHVESDRRFVQEKNLRSVEQGGDQLHLHPLAETQFPDHHAHLVTHIKQFTQLIDRALELLPFDPVDRTVQLQRFAGRKIPPEGILLTHQQRELTLQFNRPPGGVQSENTGASRGGLKQPGKHLQHGGLASPVWSQKADKLALPDRKADSIRRPRLRMTSMKESSHGTEQTILLPIGAENLRQPLNLDNRVIRHGLQSNHRVPPPARAICPVNCNCLTPS